MQGTISRAVAHWRATGVVMLPPPPPETISTVWQRLGRPLAADAAALYGAIGGFENSAMDNHLFSLWSADQIAEENALNSSPGVLFGDFLIFGHGYAVQFESPDRSSVWLEDFGDVRWQVASSLEDFLIRLLDDPRSVNLMPG